MSRLAHLVGPAKYVFTLYCIAVVLACAPFVVSRGRALRAMGLGHPLPRAWRGCSIGIGRCGFSIESGLPRLLLSCSIGLSAFGTSALHNLLGFSLWGRSFDRRAGCQNRLGCPI